MVVIKLAKCLMELLPPAWLPKLPSSCILDVLCRGSGGWTPSLGTQLAPYTKRTASWSQQILPCSVSFKNLLAFMGSCLHRSKEWPFALQSTKHRSAIISFVTSLPLLLLCVHQRAPNPMQQPRAEPTAAAGGSDCIPGWHRLV